MSVEQLSKYIASKDEKEKIAMQLVYHCAPFLKGKRVATVVALSENEEISLLENLQGTDIQVFKMQGRGKEKLYFLYRGNEYRTFLSQKSIRLFLKEYGYQGEEIGMYLEFLNERIEKSILEEGEFPHEIGVLLGYPIEDVRGFTKQKGKNFLCTGYWKVYKNEKKKRELFQLFDELRNISENEFLQGKTIQEIAA